MSVTFSKGYLLDTRITVPARSKALTLTVSDAGYRAVGCADESGITIVRDRTVAQFTDGAAVRPVQHFQAE